MKAKKNKPVTAAYLQQLERQGGRVTEYVRTKGLVTVNYVTRKGAPRTRPLKTD
jgi:hypothetical protein